MRIAICDDDHTWCTCAEHILKNFEQTIDQSFEIVCFTNGISLLEQAEPFDVLFLDIEMGIENGISVASQVNKHWEKCQIVYVTDYINYAIEVYHTEHTFYMLKDQFAVRIDEIFEKIFHEQAQREKKITFSLIGGKTLSIAPEDILYMERMRRMTKIFTKQDVYTTGENLNAIQERLPVLDFGRCHNSYIVYFPAVYLKMKDHFQLENGDKVVISRQYQRRMQEAFLRWAKMQ